ncbi:MAG TPA: N-acetyl-gamma-glutamyl-phosphate reductase [Elusimicrobiota bacterium]|nr:N-acetyl-gamma-glutamyl-phosphate reductase [Elusimicrobiota bacterium]
MKKINVSVIGATGYTGGELLKIFRRHPHVHVRHVTSESSPGKRLEEIHPSLRGQYDLVFEPMDVASLAEDTDIAFFALPHGVGIKPVAEFLRKGKKVIDLSADYRIRDGRVYEKWYNVKHQAETFLARAVYGLPEYYREAVKKADLIANPGCYATTSILAAAPLLKNQLVERDSLIVDAKSGVSGAGKKTALTYHFPEAAENFQAYNVAHHRHIPEIEQILSDISGSKSLITFVPHLVPMTRGILAVVYAKLRKKMSVEQLEAVYHRHYSGEPFIRVLSEGTLPQTKNVAHTNYCDVAVRVEARTGHVIVLAALDNLLKGASGQAVQNMNLMCGFRETEGLV